MKIHWRLASAAVAAVVVAVVDAVVAVVVVGYYINHPNSLVSFA